ncbi:MAG: hypothetical protein HYT62_00595 [Candidatus Yanofskybacteria bacterium]|nr:hypothetical protein [Candidatus Yanofskybacteria bacterium]
MYLVSIEPGNAKLVYWDGQNGYPAPSEISEAVRKEFPNNEDEDLVIVPLQNKTVLMLRSSLFTC